MLHPPLSGMLSPEAYLSTGLRAVVAIWPATFLQGSGAAIGITLINTISSSGAPPSQNPGLSICDCA